MLCDYLFSTVNFIEVGDIELGRILQEKFTPFSIEILMLCELLQIFYY